MKPHVLLGNDTAMRATRRFSTVSSNPSAPRKPIIRPFRRSYCLREDHCPCKAWQRDALKRRKRRNICVAASGAIASSWANAPAHVKAAVFTGTYAMFAGFALMMAPKTIFGLLFRYEAVPPGWIRVGGILFALIGWQYLGTALGDLHGRGAAGFYWATVWSRFALVCAFCVLCAIRETPPGLLVLAVVNLVGALSMLISLRQAAPPSVPGIDGGPSARPKRNRRSFGPS